VYNNWSFSILNKEVGDLDSWENSPLASEWITGVTESKSPGNRELPGGKKTQGICSWSPPGQPESQVEAYQMWTTLSARNGSWSFCDFLDYKKIEKQITTNQLLELH
jgi:hypothetical protein